MRVKHRGTNGAPQEYAVHVLRHRVLPSANPITQRVVLLYPEESVAVQQAPAGPMRKIPPGPARPFRPISLVRA